MGRLREHCHRKTYSVKERNTTEDSKNRRHQQRRVIPNFESLYANISEENIFQPENFRSNEFCGRYAAAHKKTCQNLTSSSTSGNDTFDRLAATLDTVLTVSPTASKQKNKKKPAAINAKDVPSLCDSFFSASPEADRESSASDKDILFSSPKVTTKLVKDKRKHGPKNKPETKWKPPSLAKPDIRQKVTPEKSTGNTMKNQKINLKSVEVIETLQEDIINNQHPLEKSAHQKGLDIPDYIRKNPVTTSTPTVRERDTIKTVLCTDLSPVHCDESFTCFDISTHGCSTSEYVTCSNDKISKILEFSTNSRRAREESNENHLLNGELDSEAAPCIGATDFNKSSLSLAVVNKYQSFRSCTSRYSSQCPTNRSFDVSHLSKTKSSFELSQSLSRCYELKINIRRRNVFHRFTNKRALKKESALSYLFSSNATLTSKTSKISLHNEGNNTSSDVFESCNLGSSTDVKNFEAESLSVSNIKGGKGWRRSMKKSITAKIQTCRDSVFVSAAAEVPSYLNNLSVLICKSVLCSENEEQLPIVIDWRTHVLGLCKQNEVVHLTDCFCSEMLQTCRKIGEGVYGEVFMASAKSSDVNASADCRVLKVMPIEGDFEVNGEPQKSFEEIATEAVISLELSKLRSLSRENSCCTYVKVHCLWCLQGFYSPELLELWDQYHEEKGSENDRPDIFPEQQLYLALEFEYGGKALESFVFSNAQQAYAIFIQLAVGLAVAEEELEFEHRDLHWGNVLILSTSEAYLEMKLKGKTYRIKTNGVRVTVIDFTLSRLLTNNSVYFNDLSNDPSMFTGKGDYQFEIYRLMREANRNNWKSFQPVTNVYWLHYIITKMIGDCYYKNKSSKIHKKGLKMLKERECQLLQYSSASQFVGGLDELSQKQMS